MKLIDFFTYIIYRFSRNKLGRSNEEAILSAIAILTIYIAYFILTISCIIGLIYENMVSRSILEMGVVFIFIIGSTSFFIFKIRYNKYYSIEQVEHKIKQLTSKKKKVYCFAIYFLYIATPLLGFIFFRLYAFGHI